MTMKPLYETRERICKFVKLVPVILSCGMEPGEEVMVGCLPASWSTAVSDGQVPAGSKGREWG